MQLAHAAHAIQSNVQLQTSTAKIKADAHMFRILSSSIYANKIRALLREISANAADAHLMLGKPDLPFKVHLPSRLQPHLWIQDFGPGMSHEFVMERYQTYGESDKRNPIVYEGMSEAEMEAARRYAETATGGFGMGSKAPYAYTDQFAVESVHNGVLRRYAMHIGSDGMFQTDLVGEQPAPPDWPHGVRVTVPVKTTDVDNFIAEAKQVFRWFRTTPEILNAQIKFPERTIQTGSITFFEVSENIYEHQGMRLHMGDCAYPILIPQLGSDFVSKLPTELARDMLNWNCAINVPMGSFDIAVSRESPDYTPRTIAFLRKTLRDTADELAEYINNTFAAETLTWTTLTPLREALDKNGNFNRYIKEALVQKGMDKTKATMIESALLQDQLYVPEYAFQKDKGHIWWYRQHRERGGKTSWRRSYVDKNINGNRMIYTSADESSTAVIVGNAPRIDQRVRKALSDGQYRQLILITPRSVVKDELNPQTKEEMAELRKQAALDAAEYATQLAKDLLELPTTTPSQLPDVPKGSRGPGTRGKYPKMPIGVAHLGADGYNSDFEADITDHEDVEHMIIHTGVHRRINSYYGSEAILKPGHNSLGRSEYECVFRAIHQDLTENPDRNDSDLNLDFFIIRQHYVDKFKLETRYNLSLIYDQLYDWFDPIGTELAKIKIKDQSGVIFLDRCKERILDVPSDGEDFIAHCYSETAWWKYFTLTSKCTSIIKSVERQTDKMRKLLGSASTKTELPANLIELSHLAQWLTPSGDTPKWDLPEACNTDKRAEIQAELDRILIGTHNYAYYGTPKHKLMEAKRIGLYSIDDPELSTAVFDRLFT